MEKIKLDILGLSSSQSQSGSFALVLGESGGTRRLPIIIGMFEAQAIAIEIEKILPNRPMTHDLFKSFGKEFGFSVEEVLISDLKEGVFFAKILCRKDGELVSIDARPSDAIAIGLRFEAEINTLPFIMKEAGIELSEEEKEKEDGGADKKEEDAEMFAKKSEAEVPAQEQPVKKEKPKGGGPYSGFSMAKLQQKLDEAIAREDYELAARIRDEMDSRK
ncbi:hypothetical protein FUAX_15520 [Fulvitalea axinellae]|uniref:BFN domain-containing protein n=1 Tax=Fulvitalea axinellae TaxID=1182444 RepID=A0AAU9DA02_9BACT|nr:hypothetical protein FUAX_15520 [Fulvitalea axinellae]